MEMVYNGYYKMFEDKTGEYPVTFASRSNIPFKQKEMVHCVSVVALRRQDGKIPVLRQYRPVVGGFVYELPAGKVDRGEDPKETAKRELMEETGLSLIETNLIGLYDIPHVFPSVGIIDECHTVVVGWCEGKPSTDNLTDHENLTIEMMDKQQLLRLLEKCRAEKSYISQGLTHFIIGLQFFNVVGFL